jgi:CheY-like chemotaxis protein
MKLFDGSSPGQPSPAAPAGKPGHASLGGYRLLYKLASGSYGRVYRAEDPATGRPVAIKALRPNRAADPGTVDLFRREARLGMTMHHPNLVEVLDLGQDERSGQHFLVMEYVQGGSLRDFLTVRGKLPVDEALRLLEDLAAGLAHAHAEGVCHRDLKLSNVLVSADGAAKLVDFGLGQSRLPAEDDLTVERTVDYAGLEDATGAPPGDARSDLYFLGCIFYEMLTGRPALSATPDRRARRRRERFERVRPLVPEDAGHRPEVLRLAETMLALDLAHRYQTAAQLLRAVREARGRPVGAGSRTVYLVEANPQFQEALRFRLKRAGYRVLLAANPERAIERFAQHGFDALVLGTSAITPEGLRALRTICGRARPSGSCCPAFVLLAPEQEGEARRIKTDPALAGVVSVLFLPFKVRDLVAQLSAVVPLDPVSSEVERIAG